MADRVVIVDDDEAVLNILNKVVKSNGISAVLVSSGEEALKKISEERFALILLDINMHGINGFEVIEQLRNDKNTTPIIVVSGRKDDFDTLYCLDIGADDYVTKPFGVRELMARVKANLRKTVYREEPAAEEEKPVGEGNFGRLDIDLDRYEVRKDGKPLDLTLREFELLKFLSERKGQGFSRETLLEKVWGYEYYGDVRTVDVTIRRLREKIEDAPGKPTYILTKRGVGYYFD